MKCKFCKNKIPDNSIYCNWCGERQIKERKKKQEIKIPKPRQLPSGKWNMVLRAEGLSSTFDTPAEAEIWAKAVRADFIEQKKKLPALTVGQAIDKYIENNYNVLSPSTIKGYKSVRANRFQAVMDKDIDSINWQSVINSEAAQVAPKTLSNAWRVVTAAMRFNNRTPPTVRLPQNPKSPRPWLDYEQIKTFLKLIEGQPCELGALLALHSLRRSEIMALDRSKIDLVKETITVSGSAVYNDKGEFVQKATNKNKSSQRIVPIIIPRLKTLLASDGDLITWQPNTLYVQINRICRANGLPEVGIHGLRHSFASLAYHLQWSEATTMSVGGWSDTKTVHTIYTHLASQDKNRDIEKMRDFFS